MELNNITVDEVEDILRGMDYNPHISKDNNGIYKIDLGNNHFIYANDKFINEFHKEMLTRMHSLKFNRAYHEYYKN